MNSYALTIKKTRGTPCISDYEQYLSFLMGKGFEIYNVNYELTRGLHCPLLIKTNWKLAPKDPSLYRDRYGYNILAVPIFFKKGWIRYAEKDKYKLEVISIKERQMMHELYEEDPRVKSEVSFMEANSEELSENHKFPALDIRKL